MEDAAQQSIDQRSAAWSQRMHDRDDCDDRSGVERTNEQATMGQLLMIVVLLILHTYARDLSTTPIIAYCRNRRIRTFHLRLSIVKLSSPPHRLLFSSPSLHLSSPSLRFSSLPILLSPIVSTHSSSLASSHRCCDGIEQHATDRRMVRRHGRRGCLLAIVVVVATTRR